MKDAKVKISLILPTEDIPSEISDRLKKVLDKKLNLSKRTLNEIIDHLFKNDDVTDFQLKLLNKSIIHLEDGLEQLFVIKELITGFIELKKQFKEKASENKFDINQNDGVNDPVEEYKAYFNDS